MVLGELGFRANRTTRAHQRTTKFLNEGTPLRSPSHFHSIRNARARFLRARKTLRFLYLRGTEASLKRYAADWKIAARFNERSWNTSVQAVPMIFVLLFPSLLLFHFVERGKNTVTSCLLFRKIYNWPFTTSVKINITARYITVTRSY